MAALECIMREGGGSSLRSTRKSSRGLRPGQHAPRSRAARLQQEVLQPQQPDVCSGHHDAIRRRVEQLQWQRQRDEERAALLRREWWHQEAGHTVTNVSSPDEFRQLVQRAKREGRLLVAKFFTQECYVCKSLYPKIRKIAAEHQDVLFAKINGSDPQCVSLFNDLGITKVPMFHMVLDGQLVAELSASLHPDKLAALRAELSAHKPAPPPPSSSSAPSTAALHETQDASGDPVGQETRDAAASPAQPHLAISA